MRRCSRASGHSCLVATHSVAALRHPRLERLPHIDRHRGVPMWAEQRPVGVCAFIGIVALGEIQRVSDPAAWNHAPSNDGISSQDFSETLQARDGGVPSISNRTAVLRGKNKKTV